MSRVKVLVVDGGGRGDTLVRKYFESPHVDEVHVVPGNDFMKFANEKPVKTYPKLKTTSVSQIVNLCVSKKISLADVAQDNAVAADLASALRREGILVIGPSAQAGELEWSKIYARNFGRLHICGHQPDFRAFDTPETGLEYIRHAMMPVYVKADGLCAGKGAFGTRTMSEVHEAIMRMGDLENNAGKRYLIEEWLGGKGALTKVEEFSAYALIVGNDVVKIGYAQDNKRLNNFDKGPMTGGVGAHSPPLVITPKIDRIVMDIFQKAADGLVKEGRPYNGILYLGGMLVSSKSGNGRVYIVEWNARWGDPECQVIVPGIINDMYEVGIATARGKISGLTISTDGKTRVAVAGVARGYPGDYSGVAGRRIWGLQKAIQMPGVTVYGAGIAVEDKKFYVAGGRLFYVVGEGDNVAEAKGRAENAISKVSIYGNGLHFRTDIADRDIERYNALAVNLRDSH